MKPSPAAAARMAAATEYQFSCRRAFATSVRCAISPYAQKPTATARRPNRTHGLVRRRLRVRRLVRLRRWRDTSASLPSAAVLPGTVRLHRPRDRPQARLRERPPARLRECPPAPSAGLSSGTIRGRRRRAAVAARERVCLPGGRAALRAGWAAGRLSRGVALDLPVGAGAHKVKAPRRGVEQFGSSLGS